ncbi:YjbH domain-containing protein [Vibrio misgurnus]|uniref:YjbH domain-containing protein n=1 Tax=Vibrio misgurnus TaxID=2993714 RepID=UPI0024163CFB|nr:YjbH domain-containing protein [Vibrio sp. gvc]
MKTGRSSQLNSSLSLLAVMVSSILMPRQAFADEFSYPPLRHAQADFGGTGLIQMPSARMLPEGELSLAVTNNDDYLHYAISLQLFPWLETTVRYTQVHALLYSNDASFSGDTKYTDKSIDAKLRLWQENYWLPDISLGLRDIGGTGLFDGEYLVATKHVGPLDFTLGVGWGYLGNRANLSGDKTASPDCGRDGSYGGNGGMFDLGRMFTGCTALFGGIEYQTPLAPLRLKLEYDGNDYRSDFPVTRGREPMPVATPWNFGMAYALTDWADLRVSYQRGNTLTAGLTLATNVASLKPTWIDSPAPTYQPAPSRTELSDEEWQNLTEDLAAIAGYQPVEVYQEHDSIVVKGTQVKYRDREQAEQRAATLIANTGIHTRSYRIIETSEDQPLTETHLNSAAFKRVIDHDYPDVKLADAKQSTHPAPNNGELKAEQQQRWSFGFSPVLQQSFGGSEDFYLYAIGINANASYKMGDHWRVSGTLYGNLIDNYDKFNYTVPPDGTDLKRVRTLSRQYFEEPIRVSHLQLTYFDQWQQFYTQAYAGYLETMFAGVGSELLYRPLGKNWAIGIDGNYVKQRDPSSIFGLYQQEHQYDADTGNKYRVQTGTLTGHATLYWQPQFWSLLDNTLLKVSAGRYLTEDIGFTVDFSKQFASGVIAGAFATKTDLSAEEFGEGSFSKGFYISIPLDLMTIRPSTERVNVSWLPLQRDGGQMLSRQYGLFKMTDARSPWYERF